MKEKELLVEIERLKKEKQAIEFLQKKFKPTIIKPKTKTVSEATAVIVASDWHIEEIVNPKTINDLNSFNLKIAEERVGNFFNNSLKLIKLFRKDIKIDNVVLCLIGDFLSGNIHEELLENCSLRPIEALWKVQNLIAGGLEIFKGERLHIVCKSGNHSRINKKVHISTEYGNALETFMYLNLAKQFPEFHWQIDESYHSYVKVFDYSIRVHHGHQVRYGGGVGGLTIPLNKAIGQWNKSKRVDYDVLGHFHNKLDGGNFVVNGSLIGYNAYAVSIKAEFEKPQQTFFLIDRDFGKTIVAPIFVDSAR